MLVSPERERLFRARQEALRVRRGARRRAGVYRRRLRHTSRRLAARALHSWRSSLQVRIGAITMVVAGTVVVIVSLVLFSQIRDQVLSVKRHLLRDASRFRLRTVQRIHALDSTGLETGLNSIVSPAPYAIAIAPAVAVPQVMPTIRLTTMAPVWGTGFVTSAAQAKEVLLAGADVVASSRPDVWLDFIRIPVRG